ncbi:MAG: glycosyl transferase [Flavobacterium sp.]|nr:MAG: glycosyl transferase [Flavobacterium sp.]
MISILIPTYNFSIGNLVKQIHQQAIDAKVIFEIIVIDDGSTNKKSIQENSAICNLSNYQYIANKENIGRTATRNLLAKTANYDYLLYLDADVLPKTTNFIKKYVESINANPAVVYGGISYYENPPEDSKILRWKYGIKREAINVEQRLKHPYFIISQNLLIKKSVFLKVNSINTNAYGLDILFSNNLKKNTINVVHIDNPVYHLGLETSKSFILKSFEAVKTTYLLEEKKLLDDDLRPLQKSYQRLKKWHITGLFNWFITLFKNNIESNLVSKNPSLFLFDLYRLHYYTQLKTDDNA